MVELITWIANAVDKPIRMMLDEREVTRCGTGENGISWPTKWSWFAIEHLISLEAGNI